MPTKDEPIHSPCPPYPNQTSPAHILPSTGHALHTSNPVLSCQCHIQAAPCPDHNMPSLNQTMKSPDHFELMPSSYPSMTSLVQYIRMPSPCQQSTCRAKPCLANAQAISSPKRDKVPHGQDSSCPVQLMTKPVNAQASPYPGHSMS
jgi:hypothetical protein